MHTVFAEALHLCVGLIIANRPSVLIPYILFFVSMVLMFFNSTIEFQALLMLFSGTFWAYFSLPFFFLLDGEPENNKILECLKNISVRIRFLLSFYMVFPTLFLIFVPIDAAGANGIRFIILDSSILYVGLTAWIIQSSLLSELIKTIPNIHSMSPNDIYTRVRTVLLNKLLTPKKASQE